VTRRQYKHDPIQEALCEVRFAAGQEWNLTMPGHLHEALKHEYSGRPRQQNILAANVIVPPGSAPGVAVAHGLGRVQFPNPDGTRLVATGPDVLSVHVLKPYPGWDDFRTRITEAVAAYRTVVLPSGALRVGLRYVNHVELQEDTPNLGDYFNCGLTSFKDPNIGATAFMHRTEYVYKDDIRLVLTFASVEPSTGASAFLLDLDLIWEAGETAAPIEKVDQVIDDLRARERDAFERLVTDKLRDLFDA